MFEELMCAACPRELGKKAARWEGSSGVSFCCVMLLRGMVSAVFIWGFMGHSVYLATAHKARRAFSSKRLLGSCKEPGLFVN